MAIEDRLDDLKTEAEIQRDIVRELKSRGAIVFRMNAGKGRINQQLAEPGTPDLLVLEPHHLYWVEVKTRTGRLSEVQKKMHRVLADLGQEVVVARGVEDVA